MAGKFRQVEAFHLNGWKIQPCHDPNEDGFDQVHGEELYHHDHLEVAVAAAQASPRPPQVNKPEEYDAWLRGVIPDDKRLEFYQWIGAQAVAELIEEARNPWARFDRDKVRESGASQEYANGWNDAVMTLGVCLDPLPSALPDGLPFCDVPHHTHPGGGGRLPTCRIDSRE
jgi:hypothetical protein